MGRMLAVLAASTMLAACATSPLDTTRVDSRATPSQVAARSVIQHGERVQWGGSIVALSNRTRSTWIEVLSYPVAYDGIPNTYARPTGRFVLRYNGFLEPQDYAPGRLLTVVGTVDSLVQTMVGKTRFVVPLVEAEQMKLWDRRYGIGSVPRFTFGVGIGVGF